jgi:hypothetical protein
MGPVGMRLQQEGSRDAAVAFNPTIAAHASYTVEVRGNGTTGRVLAEIYDATPNGSYTRTTPRLINVSVLKQLAAGDRLVAGFVMGGALPQQVVVRAVGPTLSAAFGVGDAMADPKIELFDDAHKLIASNHGWGGGPKLAQAFSVVGAFKLPEKSRDAALVVTLKPGRYSAEVSAAGGAGGVTLVELYEVP